MRTAIAAALIALAVSLAACSDSAPSQPTQPVEPTAQTQQTQQTTEQPQPASQPQPQPPADQPAAQPAPEPAEQPQAKQQSQPQPAAQPAQPTQPAQQTQAEPPTLEPVPDGTRIVSLFGDITEILYALGVEDYIVGVDVSSVYPAAAQDLPDVGFAGALSAEGILSLNPSIVIGGSTVLPGPVGVLEHLEQAGVPVLVIPELLGLDAPSIKIRMIGDAIGIPQRAAALAQQVAAEIDAVQPKPAADPQADREPLSVLFVYLRRGGIQLISGQGREAETIITAAGGVDAGAAAGIEGWQSLSPEALLAINPDVYLVMQLGYDAVGGLDGLLDIPGMAETEAGKHRRVIIMEDILLLGFGPRMADSIVQLRDYLAEVRASLEDVTDSKS